MHLGLELQKTIIGIRIIMVENREQTILTFWTQICPKMTWELEIQKSNVGVRISILEILTVSISR